jgi:hypothetical protein
MIDEREQELLLHIAAGTDPITAWAALPESGDRCSKRTGGGAEFGPTWSSVSHWGVWRRWEPVEGYLALRPAFFFIDSRKR